MPYKWSSIGFCFSLIVFFTMVHILPDDPAAVTAENRNLATFPPVTKESLATGAFMTGYEAYLSDHTAFRSHLIQSSKNIKKLYGLEQKDQPQLVVLSNDTATPPAEQKSVVRGQEGDQMIAPRQVGSILVFENKLMEIFKSNEVVESKYIQALNHYAEIQHPQYRLFSLLAPTQLEFEKPEYRQIADSEKETIQRVSKQLASPFVSVNAYEQIAAHHEESLYFRTDHHWTALGAYYAYVAFCEAAGLVPLPLDAYTPVDVQGFLGYLYNTNPKESLENNPDILTYYLPNSPTQTDKPVLFPEYGEEKAKYNIFMGGDHDIYQIETNINNGKTLVIIKDSYANCFVPWVLPHYERIILLDPRTYQGSTEDLIQQFQDVDILFLNYVFTTTFEDFIHRIEAIR